MLLHGEARLHHAPNFEDRPELGELCAWWRDGGAGVCALVGIGGSGKTAITDRFLRLLPDVLEADAHVPKDPTLPVPAQVFVSSFDDTNNAQVFLARLHAWLRDEPFVGSAPRPSLHDTLDALKVGLAAARGRLLLVLDGVERVQDDRLRGGSFGRITDSALASLIARLAAGLFPGLGAIITTRLPVAELDEDDPPHYRCIQVDGLSIQGAVALLRRHGVRDTGELRAIAEECGRHALTVDLVGGYIWVFGGGDPSVRPSAASPEELEQRIDEEPDAKRRAVLRQERRFARLTAEYRATLASQDPAALALLERACLFRLPVKAETMSAIFVGPDKERISGPALATLPPKEVRRKLAFLAGLHLLDARPTGYAAHAAVRDGFLRGLDADIARAGHEATRRSLEASLAGRPGGPAPSDPKTLECLEEIVHHTLAAGHVDEAWDIYWSRTGTYGNLGRRLGFAEMGRRIWRSFLSDDGEPRLRSQNERAYLLNNLALYHRDLGLLGAALAFFERGVAARRAMGGGRLLALGERNLSHVHLLLGDTRAARAHARAALEVDDTPSARMLAGALLARGELLTGDLAAAFATFDKTRDVKRPVDDAGNLMFYPELWEAETCLRAGDLERASAIVERALADATSSAYQLDRQLFTLLLAEVHEARGETAKAHALLDVSSDWAKAHDTRELLGRATMVRADGGRLGSRCTPGCRSSRDSATGPGRHRSHRVTNTKYAARRHFAWSSRCFA